MITCFKQFPRAIGLMFAIGPINARGGGPCRCKLFFQGPDGLRIATDDPGTPLEIKRKLKEISALCEEAGMVAGARDRASALPYWLILLYNYNPRYFKSVSEGTFWMRNLPLASIEYCEQYVFKKPGRPKSKKLTLPSQKRRGRRRKKETDEIVAQWYAKGEPDAPTLADQMFPEAGEQRHSRIEQVRGAIRREKRRKRT